MGISTDTIRDYGDDTSIEPEPFLSKYTKKPLLIYTSFCLCAAVATCSGNNFVLKTHITEMCNRDMSREEIEQSMSGIFDDLGVYGNIVEYETRGAREAAYARCFPEETPESE